MIVSTLVLAAVLLAIVGIVASFIPPQPVSAVDAREIHTAEELDAALAAQRSIRIADLRRRITNRNYWSFALFALAFLLQMTAYVLDHFAHASIAAITILPGLFIVVTVRASRRRDAQRRLDTFTGNGSP